MDQTIEPIEGFPVLPEGMERDGFLRLFRQVAADMFNLTAPRILAFVDMAETTRPSDWKRQDAEPCCWRTQTDMAKQAGKNRTTYGSHERLFEKLGLLDKRTMANGARQGFRDCGLFFSKIIALVPDMLTFREHHLEKATDHRRLCTHRSRALRECRLLLRELSDQWPDPSVALEYEEIISSWPAHKKLHSMSETTLAAHLKAVDETARLLRGLHEKALKTQHRDSEDAAPYIQDTNEDISFVSNESSVETSPSSSSKKDVGPAQASECLEDDRTDKTVGHDLKPPRWPQGAALYDICSPDMQLYLDGLKPTDRAEDLPFLEAVDAMVRELGITAHAWEKAKNVMGYARAVYAVIITDANRFHPLFPVRSPGGYLRELTSRDRENRFYLERSLFAICTRKTNHESAVDKTAKPLRGG